MLDVIVGVPTYNGSHRVDWLLESISLRTGKTINYKIVICDDSGNKDHQKKIELVVDKWKQHLLVELLINDKNIGVSSSWNRLVKCQDSRNIILINDDIIVAKDWLKNMTYFLDNNSNIGAACYDVSRINENETEILKLLKSSPVITGKSNIHIPPCLPSLSPNTKQLNSGGFYGCGCFFGFRRDKYDIVGGFDENYFVLREDTDFYTSLLSHGYPIFRLYCPRSFHMFSRTIHTASSELNIGNKYSKSKEYYNKKWKGNPPSIRRKFLSKIPTQKVKWTCNNKIYES